ncbi:MAG: CPBP family intramembrane glutamic endopeptidase [Pyrinomonadaceae bacterium]
MNAIFFNEKNGLLRSGWRAAIFLFTYIFAAVLFGLVGQAFLLVLQAAGSAGPAAHFVSNAFFSLVPAILLGWLCGKFLEKLPYRALGAAFSKGWLKHLLLGLLIGGIALSLAVGVGFAFGSIRFVLNDVSTSKIIASAALSFLVFAIAAAFEEAFFHGYLLQTFVRSDLRWFGLLLTSVLFGAVHARNPSASLIATANTILAGFWFGVAYLKTRDLWFVWGLHLMWNWMQGSFFGVEVSGLTEITTNPVFKEIDFGPTWLTGQTYGIEGGILCTIVIVISMIAVHFLPNLKPDAELLAMNAPK